MTDTKTFDQFIAQLPLKPEARAECRNELLAHGFEDAVTLRAAALETLKLTKIKPDYLQPILDHVKAFYGQ